MEALTGENPPPAMLSREKLAQAIKEEAHRLGFDACGISRAEMLDEEARRLEAWLTSGMQASMAWMERHFDKRVDPRKLVEGAQSVISVLHNYYQPVARPDDPGVGKISRYAWGDDYHEVMKEKLYALFHFIEEQVGEVHGRVFVDSAPVMDKVWARRSGLGWQGKHSNLIHRNLGSYFFIGEIILDVALPPDDPIPDYCGRCTRCIDACPTGAIVAPYVVDARRCLSYWTIEFRGETFPEAITERQEGWIFGCDVCQDVCPWNKFRKPTREPAYAPREGVVDTPLEVWEELDLEAFRRKFRRSPVKRAKYEGFMRNVRSALKRPGPSDARKDGSTAEP